MKTEFKSIALLVFILLLINCWLSLSITSSDLKTQADFSTIITKISQETDSNGRSFLDWDSSVTFYQNIVTDYPYIARELINVGTTELGETIYALHLSYQYLSVVDSLGLQNTTELLADTLKPSIIIIGGHEGNSMISHTFIWTLISKMVHGFHNNDVKIINLLKLRHIWFIPYLNIDTYKYIQSYSGPVSDVQNLVKTRKVISGWSDLDTGVNLLNNYAYEWGYDNFGSSGTECLSNYRGNAAFSAAETAAVTTLLDTAQSPTIVLSIDSSQNYIKYPYNYLNDKLDTPLNSSDSYWFYRAINRDVYNYNLGISMGNYISLFLKTNNGDNDDYFLLTKSTMSYSWNVGYKSYGTLYLNSTTQDKISTILTSNLDLGIYSIQKSGEQILAEVKFFNVCLPITDEWNEYEPNNGNWKFYFHIYIYNSGMRDLTTESTVTISISNENMSFDTNSYSSRTSAYRRNLALSQTSINKSTFYSKEKDVIDFSSLISYNSNGDLMKDSSSLGSINISLTYYGSTVLIKQIVMNSYSSYKSELDSYYSPLIERSTFIIFILFWWWIFLHSIFLVLQVKLNILERIIKKIRSIKKHEPIKEQQPVIATKEDDFLHYQMNSDPNVTGFDRSLKDSVTRSNIDLIPKIHQEMNSLRSSKDKDFTKDDDSGEICEYQTKGKIIQYKNYRKRAKANRSKVAKLATVNWTSWRGSSWRRSW